MKKLFYVFIAVCMTFACMFTFTGCSSFFDDAIHLTIIQEENEALKEENAQLKQELATLKFQIAFPNGIINEDVILNNVNLAVATEGDAIQVTGNAVVTINGGKFDGGVTPFGGAGNTAVWCNSETARVVINGGHFTINGLAEGDVGHIDLIYCTAGTIEITGGYFEGADDTVWLLNCKDANYNEGKASIVVTGGTFRNFDPSDCVSEGEHTNFVAEGYVVECEVVNEGTAEEYRLFTVVEAPEVAPEEPEAPGEF